MTYTDEYDEECTWYPFTVVCRVDSTGERREQRWLARDANHALERAHEHNPQLFKGGTDSAKAERIYADD